MPKQRFLMFWLSPTELVWYGAYFGIFSGNLRFFRLFRFVLFPNSLFGLFRFYTKTESFDVSVEPKQTEDQPKQFDREHILVFLWNFGLFRFVAEHFCLFLLFRYRYETPKQNKFFCFMVSWNKPKQKLKQILFQFFFVFFLFVLRTHSLAVMLPLNTVRDLATLSIQLFKT